MPYLRLPRLALLVTILLTGLIAGCPVDVPDDPPDTTDNANTNGDATDNGNGEPTDPLDPNGNSSDDPANDNASDDPANENTNDNASDDPVDGNANDNGGNGPVDPLPVEPQVGEVILDLGGGVSMVLALIPAGTFSMGTDSADHAALERSRPVHGVTIAEDFYIGRFEVTQAQWEAVMGDNPSDFSGSDILPVESVSWDEAIAFCEAASAATGYDIRLPTEAEWEYACRAGTTTAYSFGDDLVELDDHGWYITNGDVTTHEVGGKLPNFWNLYDMHGNVLEWCQDVWHVDYTDAPTDGTAWSAGGDATTRVLRGGAWYSVDFNLRSAYRFKYAADGRYYGIGFRVAAGS